MINFCPYCGTRNGFKNIDFCESCKSTVYTGPRVAACVFVRHLQGVVLVLRRLGIREGRWSLPGGMLQNGEEPSVAAVREIFEETGLLTKVDKNQFRVYYDSNNNSLESTITFVYPGVVIEDTMCKSDEIYEWGFFSKSNIPWANLAFESTKQAIEDLLN